MAAIRTPGNVPAPALDNNLIKYTFKDRRGFMKVPAPRNIRLLLLMKAVQEGRYRVSGKAVANALILRGLGIISPPVHQP